MNGKMVRYILGRMLGVEALLLLLPAFVGILYGEEKEALTFVIPAVILTCIFVIAGRKRPEGQVIYGKDGCCCQCLDYMVLIRSTSIYIVRKYSEFCRCIF